MISPTTLIAFFLFIATVVLCSSLLVGLIANYFLGSRPRTLLFSTSIVGVSTYFLFFLAVAFNLRSIIRWLHGPSVFVSMDVWDILLFLSGVLAVVCIIVWQILIR